MKLPALILITFVCGVTNAIAQASADDAKVAAIRDAYKKVNDQIVEMEKAPEFSSIFVTELVVNKNNASYPAVGIYNSTVRFYYTYGDREKNPYPDRLLKVMVTTRRAAKIESYEYLFSETGELIFAFGKKDGGEQRAYFQVSRLVRFQQGGSVIAVNKAEAKQAATELLAESKRMRTIFINSL